MQENQFSQLTFILMVQGLQLVDKVFGTELLISLIGV